MIIAKTVYFGSPGFSANILQTILDNPNQFPFLQISAVVTKPDKPQGRGQVVNPSEVALVAASHHLPTFKPEKLDTNNLSHIKILKPDLFLVISYGKVIPDDWLSTPHHVVNVHFSLLPKYRGALCVSEAIKNQDSTTGVSLMEMAHDLDAGPIISQRNISIAPHDNTLTLTDRLSRLAVDMLQADLAPFLAGKLMAKPQNHQQATYTPSFKTHTRQSAFVSWHDIYQALLGNNPATMSALIRSLNPDPGAWTTLPNGKEIKILDVSVQNKNLTINSIQIAGKNPITWSQLLAGHPELHFS